MSLIQWVSLWVESSSSLCLRGVWLGRRNLPQWMAGQEQPQCRHSLWPSDYFQWPSVTERHLWACIPTFLGKGKSRCFAGWHVLAACLFLLPRAWAMLFPETQHTSVFMLALFLQPGFLCSPSLLRHSLSSAADFSATSEVFYEVLIITADRPWWGNFRPGALKAVLICTLGQNQEMPLVLSCTEPKNSRKRLGLLTWLLVIFHYSYCFQKL